MITCAALTGGIGWSSWAGGATARGQVAVPDDVRCLQVVLVPVCTPRWLCAGPVRRPLIPAARVLRTALSRGN